MFGNNNFFSFFSGGTKNRELEETKALWDGAEAKWRASPLGTLDIPSLASEIVRDAIAEERIPATPVIAALCKATEELLSAEQIDELEPSWAAIEGDVETAIKFRDMARRRMLWASQYDTMRKVYVARLTSAYRVLLKAFPSACFQEWEDTKDTFGVPLIDLLDKPAETTEEVLRLFFDDDVLSLKLFDELRTFLRRNLYAASGVPIGETPRADTEVKPPTEQRNKSAREINDLYLGGTPFASLLETHIPFKVRDHIRFEHCHVIGGTGHGKTQLLQKMIYTDLVASQYDRRSVVVLDSQGDLIAKLSRLELFSPYVENGLGERFVLIDPSDVEHPPALNLFDAHLERLKEYDPIDRERVLNGVVELYETFFDALLEAELTQRQDVVFRYIARLMLTIPDATIHTLMRLMEDGKSFKPYMEKLEGSAKRFFETEFFSPSFSATKNQIAKRLWGVLSTPAFDRMFSQKENKLDLFQALNDGKIILVSTAKDTLKEEGSRLFGRFFMAMLAQATLERSTIEERKRTPTFVYADEAHEYFDDRIEMILNQARKYKVGLTLAHQNLEQLSPRLRSSLLANTSVKCAGGISARDAKAIADELHTTPDFIDSMKRRGPTTEFAVWVKNETPNAIRLSVPLGFLERQYTLDDEAYSVLLAQNRQLYCGSTDPLESVPEQAEVPKPAKIPSPPILTPGKGGDKHKHLQAVVKELAEAHGIKAAIEAPLPNGGQVDVLLERDGVLAAIEISVSTPAEHEAENVKKCLEAGAPKVAIVLAKPKPARNAYRETLMAAIPDSDRERVCFLTSEELPDFIFSLAPLPQPEERIVKGYKVKVTCAETTPDEARRRRDAVARIIAKSLQNKGG